MKFVLSEVNIKDKDNLFVNMKVAVRKYHSAVAIQDKKQEVFVVKDGIDIDPDMEKVLVSHGWRKGDPLNKVQERVISTVHLCGLNEDPADVPASPSGASGRVRVQIISLKTAKPKTTLQKVKRMTNQQKQQNKSTKVHTSSVRTETSKPVLVLFSLYLSERIKFC